MLGLGSLLSAAASLRTEVQRLFSKLRGRSTYYENNRDSQASVKDTFNYGLLDKATILLTPTATSDALVHSVKTYTGDELVDNGDFSGGTTGWTNNGTSILSVSNGVMTINRNSSGASNQCHQDLTTVNGNKYILSINQIDASHGIQLNIGGAVYANFPATIGIRKISFTASSTTTRISINPSDSTAATAQVSDVSVIDISSDFDFDRASSATRIKSDGLVQDMQSITDPELVLNGDYEELGSEEIPSIVTIDNRNGGVITQISGNSYSSTSDGSTGSTIRPRFFLATTSGKSYKLVITPTGTITGTVNFDFYDGSSYLFTNYDFTTTKEVYFTDNGGVFATFDGTQSYSITGFTISVKQVDPNDRWQLSSSNNSSSSITDKLTITCDNGDFASASQSLSLLNGNTYELSFDLTSDNSSKSIAIRDDDGAVGGLTQTISLNFTGTQTKSFIFTANANSEAFYTKRQSNSGTYTYSIDNVSVKDVTFSEDVDLARINYDGSGQNGHILLEPTRTNNLSASQDLTDNFWNTASRVSVAKSTVLSPDGETFSYKVIPSTSTSTKYLDYDYGFLSVPSGVEITYSIFAKPFGNTMFQLASSTGFNPRFQNFKLTGDGVLGLGDVDDATIEKIGDYYRCSITQTTTGTSPRVLNISYPGTSDLGRNPTFTGNGTDGVLLWGAQLEQGTYPTSYIPNVSTVDGSTVTRAAETLNNSGNTTLINSEEGVLFVEIAALANDGTYREISLNDGTTSNVLEIRYTNVSNQLQFVVRSAADGVIVNKTFALGSEGALQFNKIAFSYKSNDYKIYVNGVQVAVDTAGAMPSGLKTLSFDWGGNNDFYGKCKQLAVFNEALEDDELELLTGITNFSSFSATASGGGYTVI